MRRAPAKPTPGARTARPRALAVLAAWALTALAAVPAWAGTRAAGGQPVPGACASGQVRASLTRVAGDPGGGPDQTVYQLLLRDAGGSPCSLRGWPGLTVHGSAGGTIRATTTHVRFNDLGPVADKRTALRPGQPAVITLASPFRTSGCLTGWSLTLRLPGTTAQIPAGRPARGAVLCPSGIRLSPVYPQRTLRTAIRALTRPSKTPFRSSTADEPPLCQAPALRTRVTAVETRPAGSAVVLRLSADRACTIRSGGWPTARLGLPGGDRPIAKSDSYQPAWSTARSRYVSYTSDGSQRTAVALGPGSRVSAVLLSGGQGACQQAASATVYPTGIGLGPGATVPLPRPVRFCGQPRVLPFLPAGPHARVLSLARQALLASQAGTTAAVTAAGDSPAGFWYGSDGPLTMACGHAPYQIKGTSGNCTRTNGNYGGYLGEIGKWDVWKGCDSSGLAWNQADHNAANINKTVHRKGVGAAAYWMMAGPGRGPHPRSLTAAYAWGKAQAQRAASSASSRTLVFGYVFMDIERDTSRHELLNGWNEAWPSTCASKGSSAGIPYRVDRRALNGFWDYIRDDTPLRPGVYSSGGSHSYEWNGIFTSAEKLAGTAEWTYNSETSSLARFPAGFTSPIRARWFAGAPSRCHDLWQWTGGTTPNGITNFRVDQIDGNRVTNRDCA